MRSGRRRGSTITITDAVNAALEPRNNLPTADGFDNRGAFLASYAIIRKAARSAARTGN